MQVNQGEGKEEKNFMKRLAYLVALSIMTLLLFAPTAGAQQGQNVTVMMEDNYFEDANITVPVGTTVTWVHNGTNPHSTTSNDGIWDSGVIQPGGGSFSHTFNEPGTFSYYCKVDGHAAQGMVGTVTVTGGGGGGATSMQPKTMPSTGGPSLLLPSAALLLGAGVVGWAIVRRRTS